MKVRLQPSGELVEAESEINSGAQGTVYRVKGRADLALKIAKDPAKFTPQKIAFMVANPPSNLRPDPRMPPTIAWPLALAVDMAGVPVGFTMPRLSDCDDLFCYVHPSYRDRRATQDVAFLYHVARNVAASFVAAHSRNYVVGDVNEENVVVHRNGIVTILDADSFQVMDNRSTPSVLYRCTVNRPGFKAPELIGRDLHSHYRKPEEDLFALGVLIYKLLRGGTHPFDAVVNLADQNPKLEDRIQSNWFPHRGPGYSGRREVSPRPNDLPFEGLPPGLQRLMIACFIAGHKDPSRRPKAEDWVVYFDRSLTVPR